MNRVDSGFEKQLYIRTWKIEIFKKVNLNLTRWGSKKTETEQNQAKKETRPESFCHSPIPLESEQEGTEIKVKSFLTFRLNTEPAHYKKSD